MQEDKCMYCSSL